MPLVGFEVDDFDLLQAVFPLGQHRVIGKHVDSFDLYRGPVSDKLFPVLFRRIGHRSSNHAKVFRALIRANVEQVPAMIDVILVIGFARQNDLPIGVWIARRNVAELGRSLAERAEHDHGLVSGPLGSDIEKLVLLFVNQFVLVRAQNVAEEFVVTF